MRSSLAVRPSVATWPSLVDVRDDFGGLLKLLMGKRKVFLDISSNISAGTKNP